MASTIEKLSNAGLINPPNAVKSNTYYETIVGSVAYGVSDDLSDFDVNGFYIPGVNNLFPHLGGHIFGFDADPTTKKYQKCYQNHHVWCQDTEYDLNIYSITQYFRLCIDNNPNMVDTLFTPRECVLHSTAISEMVREKRELFLHKRCFPKYKGYAFGQMHKMQGKNPEKDSKRDKLRERYGFDVKYAYHLVRLLLECEMILTERTIDIRRHREHLKAIRRGEVTQKDIERWFAEKEVGLERAFHNSKLREEPERDAIKQLLLNCLEHHYGSLSALKTVRNESQPERAILHEIQALCDRGLA